VEVVFARGRTEEELQGEVARLSAIGFEPRSGVFVVREHWSRTEARLGRMDVLYRPMARHAQRRNGTTAASA
jgi:hypothetical protein